MDEQDTGDYKWAALIPTGIITVAAGACLIVYIGVYWYFIFCIVVGVIKIIIGAVIVYFVCKAHQESTTTRTTITLQREELQEYLARFETRRDFPPEPAGPETPQSKSNQSLQPLPGQVIP